MFSMCVCVGSVCLSLFLLLPFDHPLFSNFSKPEPEAHQQNLVTGWLGEWPGVTGLFWVADMPSPDKRLLWFMIMENLLILRKLILSVLS